MTYLILSIVTGGVQCAAQCIKKDDIIKLSFSERHTPVTFVLLQNVGQEKFGTTASESHRATQEGLVEGAK